MVAADLLDHDQPSALRAGHGERGSGAGLQRRVGAGDGVLDVVGVVVAAADVLTRPSRVD